MQPKKTILHFVYDLGRGGAETMLVRVVKELTEYRNIVVIIGLDNHFGNELQCDKLICLNFKSIIALPFALLKFRKVINAEKPDIVHTHLFWPTVIARIAVPKKFPLITTIHAFIASSVEYKHWYIRFLDKLTYRFRKSIIIIVAKGALEEYFSFLHLKPYKAYWLYTFVDVNRFNANNIIKTETDADAFRVVSVGALRIQKNYEYLINAFTRLEDKNIELHIYGVGNLQKHLQKRIDETGVKIILKGEVNNIEQIIPQYDLYVMSSSFEGFSLSVLEAMAMGMPLLLSDISSFKEQCENTADYFSLNDVDDFIQKISGLSKKESNELKAMGEKGRQRAIQNFTLPRHMEGLRKIYTAALTETF